MIKTIINIAMTGLLSVLAHYVKTSWNFLALEWIVTLIGSILLISILITGITKLCQKNWLLGSMNLVMLVPLLVFVIPVLQLL